MTTKMCSCPEFPLRTQCWANSQSRPLILSCYPILEIVWPSLHFTISSHLASSQSNCKLSFSLPKHTWVNPSLLRSSVLLRSVHWQVLDVSSYAELCKTTPHLSQLNLLAVRQTQSAIVGMLTQVKCWKREYNLPNVIMEVNSWEEGFLKISNKNNGSNQINLKMELNTYKTKLLVIAKQWAQGLGHYFQSFAKGCPSGEYLIVMFCLIFYQLIPKWSQFFFHTDFFQKIPHVTVSVFLGFADC